MFKEIYKTTILKNHITDGTIRNLKEALITDRLKPTPFGRKNNSIYYVTKESDDIRPFVLHHSLKDRDGNDIVVFDGRGIEKLTKDGAVRLNKEMLFHDLLGTLSLKTWLNDNHAELLGYGDIQILTFAKMVSENIARRKNLETEYWIPLEIITGWWYLSQFIPKEMQNDTEKASKMRRLSRVLRVDFTIVQQVLYDISFINDIGEYAVYVQSTIASERLGATFVPAVIFTMLGGIWFGPNSAEIAAVAIEYPPLFVTLMYMVLHDRAAYRNTILYQTIERVDRKQEQTTPFIKAISRLHKE